MVIIYLPTNRWNTKHEEYELESELFKDFCECYPGVNVLDELSKMRAWLIANDTRRKTKRGMKRFINSWLSRSQDKNTRGGGYRSQLLRRGTRPDKRIIHESSEFITKDLD